MTRQHIAISYPPAAAGDFAAAARIAREIRIARLQCLQARAARKFRDAHFAHQLADSARDAAAPRSAERIQASRLCDQARHQMEHWHKRSYAFARTEIQTSLQSISGGLDVC